MYVMKICAFGQKNRENFVIANELVFSENKKSISFVCLKS